MKRDRRRPRPPGLAVAEALRRDRLCEAAVKWGHLPPGIPPKLLSKFERLIKSGKTIKQLVRPRSEFFVVPETRFLKHCSLNPEWSRDIRRLSQANRRGRRLRPPSAICGKGLHPMKGTNVIIGPDGYRRCRTCQNISQVKCGGWRRNDGRPMTAEHIEQVKKALDDGLSLAQILQGRPRGGGKVDSSLIIIRKRNFYHQRKIDPEFDRFVQKHTEAAPSVASDIRQARKQGFPTEFDPTVIAVGRLKHKLKIVNHGAKP